jgi:diguanylate cyclase (GGDEF)-like protein
MRTEDITGRHEEDEFCLLLPNMSEQLAMEIAEQIRSDFELRLIVAEEHNIFATVSIGVSNSAYAGFDYTDLLAAAQSARYNAHELGRNRIVAHSAIYKIS